MRGNETWTPEMHSSLVELIGAGKTAREVAAVIGVSRNAVLGRAFRTGVPIPPKVHAPRAPKPKRVRREQYEHSAEQKERVRALYSQGLTYAQISYATGVPKGSLGMILNGLTVRRPVVWSTKSKGREFRLTALALVSSGVTYEKAAKRLGCSPKSIVNWRADRELLAQAEQIGGRIKAESAARRATLEQQREANRISRTRARDAHNAPILAHMPKRHAEICAYLLEGHTLDEAGDRFGFTRERARQIITNAINRHGLDTLDRFKGKPSYVPTGKRRGPQKGTKRPEQSARMKALWAGRYAPVVGGGHA